MLPQKSPTISISSVAPSPPPRPLKREEETAPTANTPLADELRQREDPHSEGSLWDPRLPVPDEEHVLEGVTRIEGLDSLEQLRALPSTLREATLASDFDQSLESVSLPDQLQLLRFGNEFNQSLQRWKFPEELQKLVMGNDFNQTLEQVSLPQRLQVLELGDDFDQSLQKVTWPETLNPGG